MANLPSATEIDLIYKAKIVCGECYEEAMIELHEPSLDLAAEMLFSIGWRYVTFEDTVTPATCPKCVAAIEEEHQVQY